MENFSGVSRERCDSVEGESNTPVSKKTLEAASKETITYSSSHQGQPAS